MLEKIVGKNLSEMVVPEENLWEIYGSLPHAYDAWKHLGNDFLGDYAENPETFQGLKSGKRNTEKQASLYDAMLAEIYAEHDGSKAKVRNRRRADRKHNVLPKVRKQMRYDRGWNRYCSMPCYGCKNIGIAEYRMDNAEQIARADWEIESAEIEMDAEFNFWTQKIENERLASLNEWLQYA